MATDLTLRANKDYWERRKKGGSTHKEVPGYLFKAGKAQTQPGCLTKKHEKELGRFGER